MALPASERPFKKRRRDTRERLVITCDIRLSSLRHGHHHGDYHFLETESRLAEILENSMDQHAVGGRFATARNIAEILFDDTFLALSAGRQHRSQFFGGGKCRVGKARHLALGVEIEFDRGSLLLPAVSAFSEALSEGQLELVALLA